LEGKRALIFGGTSGLGKSIALGFAEAGADVVPVSRRPEEVHKTTAEIRTLDWRTLEVPGDVINRIDIQRVVDAVLKEFGRY
jgi:NAD(P)-dependent dehydrogenase (short-subunit alcohol dehydrogenase family)